MVSRFSWDAAGDHDRSAELAHAAGEAKKRTAQDARPSKRQHDCCEGIEPAGAKRAGGLHEPIVDRGKAQADRTHQEWKRDDCRRQRGALPVEDKTQSEIVFQKSAKCSVATKQGEEKITRDNRREHERQINDRFEQEFARKIAFGKQPANDDGQWQRYHDCDRGNQQRQANGLPFGSCQHDFILYRSKASNHRSIWFRSGAEEAKLLICGRRIGRLQIVVQFLRGWIRAAVLQ